MRVSEVYGVPITAAVYSYERTEEGCIIFTCMRGVWDTRSMYSMSYMCLNVYLNGVEH